MNNQTIIRYIVSFIGIMLAQVFIFRNLDLYHTAFCFMYLNFILILPKDLSRIYLLLISFVTGLIIDVFEDTLGINAFVCVFIAYLRPSFIKMLNNQSGNMEETKDLTMGALGTGVFIVYAFLMIFTHNVLFYIIEAWSLNMLSRSLIKGVASTFYSLVVILIVQYLFYSTKRAR